MSDDTLIEFVCSHCGHTKQVKDSYLGKLAKCPECNESSVVGGSAIVEPPIALANESTPPSRSLAMSPPAPIVDGGEFSLFLFMVGKCIAIPLALLFALNVLFCISRVLGGMTSLLGTEDDLHNLSALALQFMGILGCITCIAILDMAKRRVKSGQ